MLRAQQQGNAVMTDKQLRDELQASGCGQGAWSKQQLQRGLHSGWACWCAAHMAAPLCCIARPLNRNVLTPSNIQVHP